MRSGDLNRNMIIKCLYDDDIDIDIFKNLEIGKK